MGATAGPWHRRGVRYAVAVALVLGLLASGLLGIGHPTARAQSTGGTALSPLGSRCPGAPIPANYSGTLRVEGGATPGPNVSNVSISVHYLYELNYTPKAGNSSYSCFGDSVLETTNRAGNFRADAAIPSNSCSAGSCSHYRGPFAPMTAEPVGGAPPGYFVSASVSGTEIRVDFVAALANLTLSPYGRTTTSVDAPTEIRANASAGDGSPTPASVSYDWRLAGSGWSLLNGTGTSSVTVEGYDDGSVALVTVWTNGTFNGTRVSAGPAVVQLTAIATGVDSGHVAPSAVDVGSQAVFEVTGHGAMGYSYNATFDPGLGLTSVEVPCSSQLAGGGSVSLSCSTSASYDSSGTAQPSVLLSNGFSSTRWAYPNLAVSPALGISLRPDPLLTYVGSPNAVTVEVADGSGTPPYGPACLWSGNGSYACQTNAGTSWTFPVEYPATGLYTARVSVVDSSGLNRSTAIPVEVSDRPSVEAPFTVSPTTAQDQPILVAGRVDGGAPPLSYWWNDSAPVGTLASGETGSAGWLNLSYSALTAGFHTLTLTVKDALGTVAAGSVYLQVFPGSARELYDTLGLSNGSAVAGTPFPISWAALGPFHDRLGEFAESLSIARLSGAGTSAPVWINGSRGAFELGPSSGAIVLGPSLWSDGYLNLSVTTRAAGALTLAVGSLVPVDNAPGGTIRIWVHPDALHPRLAHPHVALGGGRSNATRWQIADRYGNAFADGYVVVRSVFASGVTEVDSPVLSNGTTGFVWVNYSAPDSGAGTVYVLSEFGGQPLLPPIPVPGVALPVGWIAGLAALAVGAAATTTVAVRRRRTRLARAASLLEAGEPEMRRLAEGRAHLLARASETESRTLDELVAGFDGPPPSEEEVIEWTTGLIADGSLRTVGPAPGAPRFVRVPPPGPARVTLDPEALERALASERETDPDAGLDDPTVP